MSGRLGEVEVVVVGSSAEKEVLLLGGLPERVVWVSKAAEGGVGVAERRRDAYSKIRDTTTTSTSRSACCRRKRRRDDSPKNSGCLPAGVGALTTGATGATGATIAGATGATGATGAARSKRWDGDGELLGTGAAMASTIERMSEGRSVMSDAGETMVADCFGVA